MRRARRPRLTRKQLRRVLVEELRRALREQDDSAALQREDWWGSEVAILDDESEYTWAELMRKSFPGDVQLSIGVSNASLEDAEQKAEEAAVRARGMSMEDWEGLDKSPGWEVHVPVATAENSGRYAAIAVSGPLSDIEGSHLGSQVVVATQAD